MKETDKGEEDGGRKENTTALSFGWWRLDKLNTAALILLLIAQVSLAAMRPVVC